VSGFFDVFQDSRIKMEETCTKCINLPYPEVNGFALSGQMDLA